VVREMQTPGNRQPNRGSKIGAAGELMAGTDETETATVQRMFAAFVAGDLDALLETIHPQSRWIYYGANPRISRAEFSGREEVRRFFDGIVKRLNISAFNVREIVAQGRTVVVFGNESGTVKATGQPFHNEWAQKYVVQDGLIVEMAEYNIGVAR
jgi:ketosteroid isomerase-like protein